MDVKADIEEPQVWESKFVVKTPAPERSGMIRATSRDDSQETSLDLGRAEVATPEIGRAPIGALHVQKENAAVPKHELTIVIPPSDESERFYHHGSRATTSEVTSQQRSLDPKAPFASEQRELYVNVKETS